MKKLFSKKGFTLIELLVVITIIGILATGATTVYTSAQQKARDSIRQTDILALKSSIEQSYSDTAAYPTASGLYNAILTVGKYLPKIPKDPKTGQDDGTTAFYYIYGASHANGISGQVYELSANFENAGNAGKEKVAIDKGDDDNRWEIGNATDGSQVATGGVYTDVDDTGAASSNKNDYDGDGTADDDPSIVDTQTS